MFYDRTPQIYSKNNLKQAKTANPFHVTLLYRKQLYLWLKFKLLPLGSYSYLRRYWALPVLDVFYEKCTV